MKPDQCWKQITISFASSAQLNEQAWENVERVERVAQSDLLYFARYSSPAGHKLVIKIHTAYSCAHLKRRLGLDAGDVIVMPEPGSTAHAHGYRIIKASRKQKEPERLTHDVIHWMMNMAGFSYSTETLEYIKMAYGGVQNLRTSIGELKPDAPVPKSESATAYVGRCRKCKKVVASDKLGLQPCPLKCGGKAMMTNVKEK